MSKKGVTIVELVIVIIILILLAIIAIYNTQKLSLKAEATMYMSEFQALYTALTNLQTQDNLGIIDFNSGTFKYFNTSYYSDGITWYRVYGQDLEANNTIPNNLGLTELKKSYTFRLKDKDYNDDIYIEYWSSDVKIGNYTVHSFDDMINLMNSGAI